MSQERTSHNTSYSIVFEIQCNKNGANKTNVKILFFRLQEERRAQLPKYAPAIIPPTVTTAASPVATSTPPNLQQPPNMIATSPMLIQVSLVKFYIHGAYQ